MTKRIGTLSAVGIAVCLVGMTGCKGGNAPRASTPAVQLDRSLSEIQTGKIVAIEPLPETDEFVLCIVASSDVKKFGALAHRSQGLQIGDEAKYRHFYLFNWNQASRVKDGDYPSFMHSEQHIWLVIDKQ